MAVLSRRWFLGGLGAALAAPAIIRVAPLMRVKPLVTSLDEIRIAYALTRRKIDDDISLLMYPGLRKIAIEYRDLDELYPKIFQGQWGERICLS